jgi:hypothetical protein
VVAGPPIREEALQGPRQGVPLEDAPPTTYLRLADFWDAESGACRASVRPLSHWLSPSLTGGTLWPGGRGLRRRRVRGVVCVGVEDGPGGSRGDRIGNCAHLRVSTRGAATACHRSAGLPTDSVAAPTTRRDR